MRLGIQPLVALLPALSPQRHAAITSCAHDGHLQLLTSYQQLVGALLDEVALSTTGDTVELGLYLLEGGDSSARVLDALEAAGGRGARVSFVLDVSYVSEISRLIERTDTLIPRVAALAERHAWCDVAYRSKPDHAKYALFARTSGDEAAILGGINLGDRFGDWEDFAVRLPSAHAERLRLSLWGGPQRPPDTAAASDLDARRAAAYAGPAVAAATLAALAATTAAAVVAPAALGAGSGGALAAAGVTAAGTNALALVYGNAAGSTSALGAPFSLPYELRVLVRSLIFDRSLLGDTLAPLRAAWPVGADDVAFGGECDVAFGGGGGGLLGGGGACDDRYLPRASLPRAPSAAAVEFVANRREQGRHEIEPTFRALFSDGRFRRYRIAMAYLGHRWGVELLEFALKRGAVVELLLPACANVYAHENLKAAQALLDGGWPGLRLYLAPVMVHAKATLALRDDEGGGGGEEDDDDDALAFLGSANLVRGSMNLPVHQGLLPYDELNVLVRDAAFCRELDGALDGLFAKARRVEPGEALLADPAWRDPKGRPYSDVRAQWEELWQ